MSEAPYAECPHCGRFYLEKFHALSRRDNATHICSECATIEALAAFMTADKGGQ